MTIEKLKYLQESEDKVEFKEAKMGDFISAFEKDMNRGQVKYLVEKLIERILDKQGSGKGTFYELVKGVNSIDSIKSILNEA